MTWTIPPIPKDRIGMFRYRYTGDLSTVFIHLRDSNGTWVPSKGDTIDLDHPVNHPLLERVVLEVPEIETVPAVPENEEAPVTAIEQEN